MGSLVLASLMATIPALAHQGFGHGGASGRGYLLSALQLSDDQREQIRNIFANGRETIRPLHRQLRDKRTGLREATIAAPFDEARVRSLAQEAASIEAQMRVERARLMNGALGVLTLEQKAKLDDLRQQRRQQLKEWRQRGFSGPG